MKIQNQLMRTNTTNAYTRPMSRIYMLYRMVCSTALTLLIILMSMGSFVDPLSEDEEITPLAKVPIVLDAPSPGHAVLGEYIGGQNCPPCYSSASPSLKNLKNSNSDEFVYISYIPASYGNIYTAQAGNVAPINRVSHLSSDGANSAPQAYFGDCAKGTSSCYQGGAGGTSTYDNFFSGSGGKSNNMASSVNSYSMVISQTQNGNNAVITVEASYSGAGTSDVRVLAAVTEDVCNSYPYADGSKPGHCWKKWLVDGSNTGPISMTLSSTPTSHSWTVPVSLVNGGMSNMLTVAWLQDDWSSGSTRHSVLSATDSSMVPPIDVAIDTFTAQSTDGYAGIIAGDQVDLSLSIKNIGADVYADGGTIEVFKVDGMTETSLGSTSVNSLSVGGTQTYSTSWDSTGETIENNGDTRFRARITVADAIGSNNVLDSTVNHDATPTSVRPVPDGSSTTIPRGGSLGFDMTALPNDSVDTLETMTPELEVKHSTDSSWSSSWVSIPINTIGEGGNERYVATVVPPVSAGSGDYDIRSRWTDSRNQVSDWLETSDAFELLNGLPTVLSPTDNGYSGVPTVKVDTLETVSMVGLIADAETPLNQLTVTSNSPNFVSWDATTMTMDVQFLNVDRDAQGNIRNQGIQVTMSDGEDQNDGTVFFSVIPNGAPSWSPIPTQTISEGGSVAVALTQYLSDTDNNGVDVSESQLAALDVHVVSITPEDVVEVVLTGQTINIDTLDDDVTGTIEVVLRSSDESQSTDTTLTIIVQNINDAPRFDTSTLENIRLKVGETFTLDTSLYSSDVDDDDANIFAQVSSSEPGSVTPIAIGVYTMTWQTEGPQLVQVSLSDPNGAIGQYSFTVDVIGDILLTWDEGNGGDMSLVYDTIDYGTSPKVTVSYLGAETFSNVEVTWQICNTITGTCHTIDTLQGFDVEFDVISVYPEGLRSGDEIKIDVIASDTSGFDYKSINSFSLMSTQPVVVDSDGDGVEDANDAFPDDPSETLDTDGDGVGDNADAFPEDETKHEQTSGISSAGGSLVMILGVVGLFLVGAVGLGLLFVARKNRVPEAVDWSKTIPAADHSANSMYGGAEHLFQQPVVQAPPVQQGPPLPVGGLPPGWTMEQWAYYGQQYLDNGGKL